jgi:hypothetical protein
MNISITRKSIHKEEKKEGNITNRENKRKGNHKSSKAYKDE